MISFIYLLYFRPMHSYLLHLHHHHHLLIIILTQSQYKRVWYPILCHIIPNWLAHNRSSSSCCLLCKGSTYSIMNPLPPSFIMGLGKGEGNVSYCTSNRNPPPTTQKIHLKGLGWTKTNTPRLHV